MLLLLHILVAFASMGYSFYVFLSPSKSKLRIAYSLAAITLASGIFLLAENPSHLVPACVMGFIYFGIVGAVIVSARNKLAAIRENL